MTCWLMKSEPSVYSIDQLARDGFSAWEGVRNYQARNLMRDSMQVGDLALFYHSSCKPPGVVGICRICATKIVDATAFDPRSPYFDPRSKKENPRWWMVEIEFVEKFTTMVTLAELKKNKLLQTLPLLQKGNRLSVMPVNDEQFNLIATLAQTKIGIPD